MMGKGLTLGHRREMAVKKSMELGCVTLIVL